MMAMKRENGRNLSREEFQCVRAVNNESSDVLSDRLGRQAGDKES
jgi:hypothetical protein